MPRSRPPDSDGEPDLFGTPAVTSVLKPVAGRATDRGATASLPGRRLRATLAATLIADGRGFVTRPVPRLDLTLDGIVGDRHHGASRPADARVPWYPRGTAIRNSRQISIVAPDELAEIARRLRIDEVRPEWVGANLVLEGLPDLTHLPPGTRLHFPGGAALVIEGENKPCRLAGSQVRRSLGLEREPSAPGCDNKGQGKGETAEGGEAPAPEARDLPLDLAFVQAGAGLRGVVAWVERAGELVAGTVIDVRVPPQKLWQP